MPGKKAYHAYYYKEALEDGNILKHDSLSVLPHCSHALYMNHALW